MPPNGPAAPKKNPKRALKKARKDLLVKYVSAERGRFPDNCQPPNLSSWRNNLTGLSQVYNLYFVACEDAIYVYQPLNATQYIAERGTVILDLPKTAGSNERGVIEPDEPHSVNNLLVGNLGEDEILLCCCDDGDVLAYSTRKIQAEMMRLTAHYAVDSPHRDEYLFAAVRPLMHVNVQMSAWGLAIHSRLRLIAVSCNSHVITVYAFALSDDRSDDDDGDGDGDLHGGYLDFSASAKDREGEESVLSASTSSDTSEASTEEFGFVLPSESCQDYLSDRRRNCFFDLCGHVNNIPVLCFCPHDEDDGKVTKLASSDIQGTTIIWDVNTASQLRRLEPFNAPTGDFALSGWGLLSIDPSCFRKKTALVDAFKVCQGIQISQRGQFFADISNSRYLVPHSQPWYIRNPRDAPGDEEEIYSSETYDDRTIALAFGDDAISASISPWHRLNEILECNHDGTIPVHTVTRRSSANFGGDMLLAMGGLDGILVEPQNELLEPAADVRWCPLLLTHPRAVQLFQSPKWSGTYASAQQPIVFCSDPLQQGIDDGNFAAAFYRYDRMNMVIQIPDLGAILIASPKGRAAVFSLHQIDSAALPIKNRTGPVYTLRLDYLLPLAAQEQQLQRPKLPMVGIAASPLPGMMESHDKSRWRILMLYRNHTLLSYEISRPHDEIDIIPL